MRLLSRTLDAIRRLIQKSRVERELDDELRAYVEMSADQKSAAGMDPAEALRTARAEAGSLEAVKDRVRDVGWESVVESVWRDVRFAFRLFRKHPGFALAVIATVAIGVGGTTAIFSVVDGLFLRAPAGVADAASLRKVFIKRNAGNLQTPVGGPGSWVDYSTMRDNSHAFTGIAAYLPPTPVDLGRGAQVEQVRASIVSDDFLPVLGVRAAAGRLFLPEEDRVPGEHPVALISDSLWQSRFGGASDVVGRTLLVNGVPIEIVGVTQKGFTGIDADPVGMWLPSAMSDRLHIYDFLGSDWRQGALLIGVHYVARVTRGVHDSEAIRRASASLAHRAESEPELDKSPEVLLTPLVQAATPFTNPAADLSLWLALVATIVLIIGCANVANLLLARAIGRRRELAIRLSIGAGRWRVARQHLTESLVLAVLGGAAGVGLSYAGMRIMSQFPLPASAGHLDARLLGFAFATSLLTGILFGAVPAVRAVQIDPVDALKESGCGGASRRNYTRGTLVALQIALSLALLVGADLFVRSLFKVNHTEPGVDVDRLLVAKVDLRTAGYTPATREAFFDLALSRLRSLPQVEHAATVHFEPFYGATSGVPWHLAGREQQEQQGATMNLAGANYFETAGTRVLRGRGISEIDRVGTERVAVVDEPLARLLADDGNAVGSCVQFGSQVSKGGCTRIVGVIERQRRWFLESDSEALPTVFFARAQGPDDISFGVPAVLIRTRGPSAQHADAIHAVLQTIQPNLPYVMVTPLAESIRSAVLPFRLGAMLFSLFSMLALVLACVGLCGVLGYFVTERTAEIGIRRSLGAPIRSVVFLVARQGLVPVAIGVVLGLLTAVAGTRYIQSLLYGTDAKDPASFGTAAMILVAVAVLAVMLPAFRAARIDPMVALRNE